MTSNKLLMAILVSASLVGACSKSNEPATPAQKPGTPATAAKTGPIPVTAKEHVPVLVGEPNSGDKSYVDYADKNKDGKVSAEEYTASPFKGFEFEKYDINKDGSLDAAEVHVIRHDLMQSIMDKQSEAARANRPGGPNHRPQRPGQAGQAQPAHPAPQTIKMAPQAAKATPAPAVTPAPATAPAPTVAPAPAPAPAEKK